MLLPASCADAGAFKAADCFCHRILADSVNMPALGSSNFRLCALTAWGDMTGGSVAQEIGGGSGGGAPAAGAGGVGASGVGVDLSMDGTGTGIVAAVGSTAVCAPPESMASVIPCSAGSGEECGPLIVRVEVAAAHRPGVEFSAPQPACVGRPPAHPQQPLRINGESVMHDGDGEAAPASSEPTTVPTPEMNSANFVPVIRSGVAAERGQRRTMEDEHVQIDDLSGEVIRLGVDTSRWTPTLAEDFTPRAFFGLFDGHGGVYAAHFARKHLLRTILAEPHFPSATALISAFLATDGALRAASTTEDAAECGTTALTALIWGRRLYVANVGDSRAVVSHRGTAVELSEDQRPSCKEECTRILKAGGYVDEGYLNGQLGVSRALGDFHIKQFDGENEGDGRSVACGALIATPEVREICLDDGHEFLLLACDGLFEVFSSQGAVSFAREQLRKHNDPARCSAALVEEALRRDSSDNVTVVTVCFQTILPKSRAKSGFPRRLSSQALDKLGSLL